MELMYKEFMNDDEVVSAVTRLKEEVKEDQIYIVTHDDDRTDRVADRANANTVGMDETGFGVSLKNVFRKQGDELRTQLEELGFGEAEAQGLEEQLDKGTVIVVVQDPPEGLVI